MFLDFPVGCVTGLPSGVAVVTSSRALAGGAAKTIWVEAAEPARLATRAGAIQNTWTKPS
ncbi:hypothetical protein [Streptomyces sp. NPDC052494]|uniref:hypothetical protein n=1 Tax=Streptomyces sp. NPDC052494 TaxID=3365692 RepID=UPI0037D7A67B